MEPTAALLILVFLALTFLMSSFEKITNWKGTIAWFKGLFAGTFLKNTIPLVTIILLVTELIAGLASIIGVVELYVNDEKMFGYYGCVFSCISLLFMLFGQRLIKDYDGSRNIVIYFIPAVFGVFLLS